MSARVLALSDSPPSAAAGPVLVPRAHSPGSHARLAVVILNFNGIDDTLACLETLQAQTCQTFRTHVIDNASRADDLSRIGARFPAVALTALPHNLGWAGGNNVGLREALAHGDDAVLLLNNDTLLDPTAIQELLRAADILARPCLLHPAIAFADAPGTWQLNPALPETADAAAANLARTAGILPMDHAYGACLLLPRAAIDAVGLLDERFFLQLEETDWFHRAHALGIGSFCATRARILHKESASFGARITAAKTYYQVRNTLLLAQKHEPGVAGLLRASRRIVWSLRHQAERTGGVRSWPGFLRWMMSPTPLARAARHGARDFARRRFGPRPEHPPAE